MLQLGFLTATLPSAFSWFTAENICYVKMTPCLVVKMLFFLMMSVLVSTTKADASYSSLDAGVENLALTATINHKERQESLAVVMVLSKKCDNFTRLVCNLKLFRKNVMETTPSFIYVFARNTTFTVAERDLLQKLDPYRLHVLPLEEKDFSSPYMEQYLAPRETWRLPQFGDDYRRVGHWRMTFQMSFAKRLGHRYVMALDDDAHVLSKLNYNIVTSFSQNKTLLATKAVLPDDSIAELGLAELTRYHIITSGIQPTQLYEHCQPPRLEGVFTRIPSPHYAPKTMPESWNTTFVKSQRYMGWDSSVIYGYIYVLDVDFWFQKEVQRYVRLVIGSGGHFKERWNEQGVITMVWLLFIPKGGFKFLEADISHSKIFDVCPRVPK